jgi:hypothetical protein
MKIDYTQWTIVVIGLWNRHIFSPKWVADNLFQVAQVETQLIIGPTSTPFRYSVGNVTLVPAGDRLIVGAKVNTDEALTLAESIGTKALGLLSHTPVSAVGVNFGFTEETPPPEFVALFQISDATKLADAGCEIVGTEILRKLNKNDSVLNVKLVHEKTTVRIHMNFHYDVASASDAAEQLKGKLVPNRNTSLELLSQVYGLNVEEEVQNGN